MYYKLLLLLNISFCLLAMEGEKSKVNKNKRKIDTLELNEVNENKKIKSDINKQELDANFDENIKEILRDYVYGHRFFYQFDHNTSGHTNYLMALAFSPKGKYLASGGNDNTIKIWDMDNLNKACIYEFNHTNKGHTQTVTTLAFSSQGKLASGSNDKTIKIWDIDTKVCLHTLDSSLKGHNQRVYKLAFSPDGKYLASSAASGTLKVWEMDNKMAVNDINTREHTNHIYSLVFSPDNRFLLSSSCEIIVWNMEKDSKNFLKKVAIFDEADFDDEMSPPHINGLTFSPCGKFLASGTANIIKLWSWNSQGTLRLIDSKDNLSNIYALTFSPCGKFVAAGLENGTVNIWYVNIKNQTLECINTFNNTNGGHNQLVYTLLFSPRGNLLVSGGHDNIIKLWRMG